VAELSRLHDAPLISRRMPTFGLQKILVILVTIRTAGKMMTFYGFNSTVHVSIYTESNERMISES
jgi:energy-converting hydrogenase Eha subunit H